MPRINRLAGFVALGVVSATLHTTSAPRRATSAIDCAFDSCNTSNVVPTFKKTVAGIAELERHTMQLRPELRRLLIMIDGKRSIESLAPFFRSNEIAALVDELLQCGAIDTAVQATSYLPLSQYDGAAAHSSAPQNAKLAINTKAPSMAHPSSASSASSATRGSLSAAQLAAAIAQTKSYTKARFNRGSVRFTSQLEKCTDSQGLRLIVSDIQLKLIADFGEEAATDFVVSIREAVRRAG